MDSCSSSQGGRGATALLLWGHLRTRHSIRRPDTGSIWYTLKTATHSGLQVFSFFFLALSRCSQPACLSVGGPMNDEGFMFDGRRCCLFVSHDDDAVFALLVFSLVFPDLSVTLSMYIRQAPLFCVCVCVHPVPLCLSCLPSHRTASSCEPKSCSTWTMTGLPCE